MATCEVQVLLQYSEEMKITWCEMPAVGRVFQCLYGLIILHICFVPPNDFHLFELFKKHLAGRHFRTDGEIQENVVKWLRDLDPDFFYAGFDKLVHRWSKCFNNHADYVEK
ncbi:hypothetical protein AVEN_201871-1 [Araneus ventricosus]|uniref:Histone-lysine N-methyltransferase SETMAR n=1 Tax=Araneus ventricosus TaxID=182803 RepID=A0A4Y2J0C8_ARAVE|nr:hypothetical protein AVEN_201871-1 [Araneus ventricosus]